jgi:hypothetical protein
MTNQGVHTVKKNIKKDLVKTIQNQRISQNKRAYEKRKASTPDKSKEQLLNYYRQKYGDGLVRDYVKILGVMGALEALKAYKNELKQDPLFYIKL